MDLIKKQPALTFLILGFALLTTMSGVAISRLRSWENVFAQTDPSIATGSSFACEPLVFTLSATDESTASASPVAIASGSASPTPRVSPTPTTSTSPTPTSTASPRASATATIKPSATATAQSTASLPDAGISTPTIIGAVTGMLLLLGAAILAFK